MPDFNSGFVQGSAPRSYPGPLPVVPTPPATAAAALPGAAPALDLNLGTVTIIVAGDINITTTFGNAVVQRR